ncbi:MAG TPA: alpha/beta hydrolase [Clostridia bacterium]|nr:alpha/beta hydrolase [Clostridia bacterium]
MSWQRLTITNKSGLKLAGLLRADKSPCGANITGLSSALQPLVIVCHGFTGSKEGDGGSIAMGDELARRGFATLLFDFAGCGDSEGLWEELTLSGQIDDLGAVVGWARANGYQRIILNGRSFGGTTVLAFAASDKGIDAACTWAASAKPLHLFSGFCGSDPVDNGLLLNGSPDERIMLQSDNGALYLQRRFFQDLAQYDIPEYAKRIGTRPLLLIHGTADDVVPVSDVHLLFDAADEPKKMVLVENADHTFSDHRVRVWDVFFDWLKDLKWDGGHR